MHQNQKGITLIELLVTLAILSLIGIIIWNVFFQGMKFSEKSVTKNTMQQEANLLITNLKKIHQTSKLYEISSSTCKITVSITKQDDTTQTVEFNYPDFCISFDHSIDGEVEPDIEDLNLTVTIYEKKDPKNKVEVDTILYRLKDGGI
ncbi:type II secretion system protein [Neobacillus sp. 19]|uniref:type II secretion system protein n=1 Tax=Neobacillus sp. 19 TaxID=3394458 RepID=UPI003BF6CD8A